jgi:hypothetical protein
MTQVTETQELLVTYFTGLADYIGLGTATGTPGNTPTPSNEATGGSPAYARIATTWDVTGPSALGESVTMNVAPGTYAYMLLCSASSGNNMVDWCPVTSQVCPSQTTITIVPLATAS